MRLPPVIFVATQPVNLRLSFDRLAGLVREQLKRDPRSDALFVFHNKRKTLMFLSVILASRKLLHRCRVQTIATCLPKLSPPTGLGVDMVSYSLKLSPGPRE